MSVCDQDILCVFCVEIVPVYECLSLFSSKRSHYGGDVEADTVRQPLVELRCHQHVFFFSTNLHLSEHDSRENLNYLLFVIIFIFQTEFRSLRPTFFVSCYNRV